MLKPTLILCHGYGLTSSYWNYLIPYFLDYEIVNVDLGYFSDTPILPNIHSTKTMVFALGHSLGWAKLENMQIPLRASIGLQAFSHFCGYQKSLRQQRIQQLHQLQQMFNKNPKSCLRYFYLRAGLPCFWPNISIPNLALLAQDLQRLNSEFLVRHHPKLIIGAEDDPIVPPELIIDNFEKQTNVDYILLKQGKHALGYQYPEIIAPIIRDFFNAHQKHQTQF